MKRKDGKKKIRSPRNMPVYDEGYSRTLSENRAKLDSETSHSVVSLFSGCGGLDLGFLGGFDIFGKHYQALPFSILEAIDNNPDAVEAYRLNIGSHVKEGDLTVLQANQLPYADVLIGGFPCQDFSSSGPKVGLNGERGQLYTVLRDYMSYHQPKVVVAENVPHLARLESGKYLEIILRDFEECGYRFTVWELFAPDYGLPQSRRRLILVGIRNDLPGAIRKPETVISAEYFSIDEAIDDLIDVQDETVTNQSQYFMASKASSGGGQGDHTNERGKLAYCIRANSRGRIQFHYELERRLTVRECARLQSFPDGFVFPYSTQRNLTLIGNAVPPILGHAVAASVANYLEHPEENVATSKQSNSEFSIQLDLV